MGDEDFASRLNARLATGPSSEQRYVAPDHYEPQRKATNVKAPTLFSNLAPGSGDLPDRVPTYVPGGSAELDGLDAALAALEGGSTRDSMRSEPMSDLDDALAALTGVFGGAAPGGSTAGGAGGGGAASSGDYDPLAGLDDALAALSEPSGRVDPPPAMSQDDDPLAGLDDALAALGGDTGYRMRTETETLTGLDSALNSLHDRSYTAIDRPAAKTGAGGGGGGFTMTAGSTADDPNDPLAGLDDALAALTDGTPLDAPARPARTKRAKKPAYVPEPEHKALLEEYGVTTNLALAPKEELKSTVGLGGFDDISEPEPEPEPEAEPAWQEASPGASGSFAAAQDGTAATTATAASAAPARAPVEPVTKEEEVAALSREDKIYRATMMAVEWANARLAVRDLEIDNVYQDLKDGVMLNVLVELITGHRMPYNATPYEITHSMDNIQGVLDLLVKAGCGGFVETDGGRWSKTCVDIYHGLSMPTLYILHGVKKLER